MVVICLRCGKCCYYVKGDGLVKCPHLVKLKNGKTLCRKYPSRKRLILDKVDGMIIRCVDRNLVPFNYPGCPFNEPENVKCPYWEDLEND